MDRLRQNIYQQMVAFIEGTSLYTLEDIAEIIHASFSELTAVLNDTDFPKNKLAEMNLARLYIIALDLYHHHQSQGAPGNEDI